MLMNVISNQIKTINFGTQVEFKDLQWQFNI